ncbi:hypothetical protein BJF79_03450 [Actinomadura sp. CNU-125]|uniref:hypothetical protein n=1 Tax=Actinomadura sp. CNU-125 TaxID=1904961 RepID=UPI000962B911|nr:hypothetical protein [Actinomadura sp. CNU-125]OLT12969.1 hypothetical protein BJF79_03450 [Actinomadura sp. CNU-125]
MYAYTTTTGDQCPGWDTFDRLVAQAAVGLPNATVDTIAAVLPAGISYHLIETTLRRTATTPSNVRHLPRTHHLGHQAAA